mmetsp:Transcript_23446/g.34985  ORF Transcript_23446/g.34985 Transcript_23446/m.34985 type:complete len:307 (-) Transcript_23446:3763-4683(-)
MAYVTGAFRVLALRARGGGATDATDSSSSSKSIPSSSSLSMSTTTFFLPRPFPAVVVFTFLAAGFLATAFLAAGFLAAAFLAADFLTATFFFGAGFSSSSVPSKDGLSKSPSALGDGRFLPLLLSSDSASLLRSDDTTSLFTFFGSGDRSKLIRAVTSSIDFSSMLATLEEETGASGTIVSFVFLVTVSLGTSFFTALCAGLFFEAAGFCRVTKSSSEPEFIFSSSEESSSRSLSQSSFFFFFFFAAVAFFFVTLAWRFLLFDWALRSSSSAASIAASRSSSASSILSRSFCQILLGDVASNSSTA